MKCESVPFYLSAFSQGTKFWPCQIRVLKQCAMHACRFFAQEPRPFIITTGRGTPHKPNPIDKRGFAIHEASMNAEWLIKRGVPHHFILEENSSMETVGNAYFARILHADVLSFKHIAGGFLHMKLDSLLPEFLI